MATETIVKFVSDLSGEEYTPGTTGETLEFSLDGMGYEIDVTTKEGAALRDALALYIGLARHVKGKAGRKASSAPSSGKSSDTAEARAWLKAKGYKVKAKGRIPAELLSLYRFQTENAEDIAATVQADQKGLTIVPEDETHPNVLEALGQEEEPPAAVQPMLELVSNEDTPDADVVTETTETRVTDTPSENATDGGDEDGDIVAWFTATGKTLTTRRDGKPDSAARRKYRRHHGIGA